MRFNWKCPQNKVCDRSYHISQMVMNEERMSVLRRQRDEAAFHSVNQAEGKVSFLKKFKL